MWRALIYTDEGGEAREHGVINVAPRPYSLGALQRLGVVGGLTGERLKAIGLPEDITPLASRLGALGRTWGGRAGRRKA